MKGSIVFPTATAFLTLISYMAFSQQPDPVQRLDPEMDKLLAKDAKVERLATSPDFTWTEGPIWIHSGYLLFAEIPSNSIRKWSPESGLSLFLQPSGYRNPKPFAGKEPGSNGMTLDRKGRLTMAGHARRNVWRLESLDPTAQQTVLADSYEGKPLNSPNDLVYKSDGSLYFTDPPYGLATQKDNDPEKALKFSGVYRIPGALDQAPGSPPANNKLQLLNADLPRPNGIAFSPDEKYLYVDNSEPQRIWMRFEVKPDGTLGTGMVFHDASSDKGTGAPDGLKVDRQGHLYSTGPGGVLVFSPAGKHLGTIAVPERTANLAWGDADAKTLYITASSSIYKIRTNVPGIRP